MDAAELLTQSVDKSQCETKFIEVERKLQKVEAALTILEAKLASIPDLEDKETNKPVPDSETPISSEQSQDESKTELANATSEIEKETSIPTGIRVTEHSIYKKFFKMLQVGVPPPAVKIKMQSEGVDPNILDNPQAIVPLEGEDES